MFGIKYFICLTETASFAKVLISLSETNVEYRSSLTYYYNCFNHIRLVHAKG